VRAFPLCVVEIHLRWRRKELSHRGCTVVKRAIVVAPGAGPARNRTRQGLVSSFLRRTGAAHPTVGYDADCPARYAVSVRTEKLHCR
jgi:hypothetical protein